MFHFMRILDKVKFRISRRLLLIVLVLAVFLSSAFVVKTFLLPKPTEPIGLDKMSFENGKPASFENERTDIQAYYRVYREPYVIFLRKALDAYLDRDGNRACLISAAVNKSESTFSGITAGLTAFDESYYRSKFVVMTYADDERNGKIIQIIFQDNPDRIFFSWVGKNSAGNTCLLGFNSKTGIDPEEVRQLLTEYYGPILFDKKHSL